MEFSDSNAQLVHRFFCIFNALNLQVMDYFIKHEQCTHIYTAIVSPPKIYVGNLSPNAAVLGNEA